MKARLAVLVAASAAVAACGDGADSTGGNAAANQSASASATSKPRPAYCFFKDAETKGWAASVDPQGNVVVKGQAYRSDPRYKAALGEPAVTGNAAELSPTITVNDTGFASPGNWWDVSATIPNSAAVETVTVRCGKKTLAELRVAR